MASGRRLRRRRNPAGGEPGVSYRPYHVSDGSTLVLDHNDDLGLDLRAAAEPYANVREPDNDDRCSRPSFVEQNAEVSPMAGGWPISRTNRAATKSTCDPSRISTAGRWLVSTNGGRAPFVARNGRGTLLRHSDGAVMSVRVHTERLGNMDAAMQVVRPGYFHAGEVHRTFDVSPDGERFLMIKQTANAGDVRRSIVVVQNWTEELKRLVPTR